MPLKTVLEIYSEEQIILNSIEWFAVGIIQLDLSPELKATYKLYQDLLFTIQSKNVNRFNHLLETEHPMISPELQTAFQTFKTYTSYIYHTLTTPYTNGPIEGINNKIKVIKRIAFGYRSFYHFKSRILMIQTLTKPKLKILAA